MRTVADVMTNDPVTVPTTEVVGTLRDLMLDGQIHALPVVDADGTLAGIVTSSDLVEEWAPEMGVATVMTDQVLAVAGDTTLVDAARTMLDHRIHHLVIEHGGRVAGILSSFDLLHELAGEVELAASVTAGAARPPATVGDHVVIRGHAIGRKERRGVITEIRGPDGGPPYVVHWLDDPHAEPHDVLFFPSSDADVEPAPAD